MRPEMLKRLDDLIGEISKMRDAPGQYGLLGWDDRWAALRDELVAERCEHCRFCVVGAPSRFDGRPQCEGGISMDVAAAALLVEPDFYCAYFEKKES